MEWLTIVILVPIIFLSAVLAAAGGTGGGAMYISAYVSTLKDTHICVPLSKVTILGACLVPALANVGRRHPTSHGPLIAYELAAILEPFTLLGAIVGVLLNVFMTHTQILTCLTITLCFTTYRTFTKAIKQRREESKKLRSINNGVNHEENGDSEEGDGTRRAEERIGAAIQGRVTPGNDAHSSLQSNLLGGTEERLRLIDTSNPGSIGENDNMEGVNNSNNRTNEKRSPEQRQQQQKQQQHHHLDNIADCCGIGIDNRDYGAIGDTSSDKQVDTTFFPVSEQPFEAEGFAVAEADDTTAMERHVLGFGVVHIYSIVFLLIDASINVLLLYSVGGPLALICGRSKNQFLLLVLLSLHVLLTYFFGRWLYHSHLDRRNKGLGDRPIAEGGLGWVQPKNLVIYPMLSMGAGIMAGAVGIGGGLIKGPLLLEIGLNPLAAVSTANFMILFTSSANTLQYALSGRIAFGDACIFFLTALIAGSIGLFIVFMMMKKTHRQSYLTFLLAFVTSISLLAMLVCAYTGYSPLQRHKIYNVEDACEYYHKHY